MSNDSKTSDERVNSSCALHLSSMGVSVYELSSFDPLKVTLPTKQKIQL